MCYWPVRGHHLLFACRDSADAKVVDVANREGEASETTDASASNLFETELKLKKSRFRQAEAFWFPRVRKGEKVMDRQKSNMQTQADYCNT